MGTKGIARRRMATATTRRNDRTTVTDGQPVRHRLMAASHRGVTWTGCNARNLPAIEAYRKIGFVDTGGRHEEGFGPQLIFAKPLG